MSDSVQPHRQQSTRLPYPWDSPGKNTAVGCHFLLQCLQVKIKVKSLSHVQIISRKEQFVLTHYNSSHFGKQSLSHLNVRNNTTHTEHWHFYIGRVKRK